MHTEALQYTTYFGGEQIKQVTGNFGNSSTTLFGGCRDCPQDFTLFQFSIGFDDKPEEISWELLDACGLPIWTMENNSMWRPNKYFYYEQCVPVDECLTFNLTDSGGNGFQSSYKNLWDPGTFNIWWNSSQIRSVTGNFGSNDVSELGYCNMSMPLIDTTCPEGKDLFQLYIKTDENPSDMSWRLLDGNDTAILENHCTMKPLREYYFETCANTTDCLNFTIEDSSQDGFYPELGYYDVRVGGEQIKQVAGNFGNSSTTLFGGCRDCPQDFTLFQFSIGFDDKPEEISWELMDSSNTSIWSSQDTTVERNDTYLYYEHCVPLDECLTFNLTDNNLTGNLVTDRKSFMIQWNSTLVKYVTQEFDSHNVTQFGHCD